MKYQGIIINVLIALVAALASHIFWPADFLTSKPMNQVSHAPSLSPTGAVPSFPSSQPGQSSLQALAPVIHARVAKAREEAFAAHPELQKEEDELKQESLAMMKQEPPATSEERMALRAKWQDHAKKVREAEEQADPQLVPMLAKVAAQMQ